MPQPILFITANRIGDAVLTTGLLRHLLERYPEGRFTVVCGPVAASLFRALPRLERLVVLRKKKWNGHWLGLWRDCVGTRWDMVVDLRNSLVSRLLCARHIGRRPPHASGRHRVLDNAAALHLDPPPAPTLWLDDKARTIASGMVPDGPPVLALAPAANWPAKQWPIERFIKLAQTLTVPDGLLPNARILVVAAPQERDQVEPLIQAFPQERIINGIGLELLDAAACLARCRLFIGNDSGLMHIAAAMNTPTLGLFGPGYETIYGPWGDRATWVRTPESTAELLAKLPYPGAFAPNLMGTLTVEAVTAAARDLLGRTG